MLSGWVAAAIATAAAIAIYLQTQRLSGEFDEMDADSAEMTQRIRALSQDIETMEHVNADLARHAEETAQAARPEAYEEPAPLPGAAEAPAEEKKPRSVLKMSDGLVASLVGMQVNSEYGEFLDGLRLSEERARKVRAILHEVLGERLQYAEAKPGERDAFEVPAGMAPAEYYAMRLRSDLLPVLTTQEMEYFDEYRAGQPTRQIRTVYEGLLIQSAAGLTDETRVIVLDVLMDEFRIGIDEFRRAIEAHDKPILGRDVEEILSRQMNTFYRSVERLADILDEDQMAVMERFIETQEMRQSLEPQ